MKAGEFAQLLLRLMENIRSVMPLRRFHKLDDNFVVVADVAVLVGHPAGSYAGGGSFWLFFEFLRDCDRAIRAGGIRQKSFPRFRARREPSGARREARQERCARRNSAARLFASAASSGFAPLNPWPTPGMVMNSCSTPAALNLAAIFFDSSYGTSVSAVP